MTSKEAFLELLCLVNLGDKRKGDLATKYAKIILKDLEVLEIIKKYAYEINFSTENEDTKKVEDWLYDDK